MRVCGGRRILREDQRYKSVVFYEKDRQAVLGLKLQLDAGIAYARSKQEVFHRSDDENELRLGFATNSSEDKLNIRLNSIGWSPQQEWNGK